MSQNPSLRPQRQVPSSVHMTTSPQAQNTELAQFSNSLKENAATVTYPRTVTKLTSLQPLDLAPIPPTFTWREHTSTSLNAWLTEVTENKSRSPSPYAQRHLGRTHTQTHTLQLCDPPTHNADKLPDPLSTAAVPLYTPRASWTTSSTPSHDPGPPLALVLTLAPGQVKGTHPAQPLDAARRLVLQQQLVGAASGPVHLPQHHVE